MNSKQPIRLLRNLTVVLIVFTFASPVFAGTSGGAGLPWEGPLQKLIDSITGPVVQAFMVLAVVSLGLGLAFSDGGGLVRRILGVLFGLSIAATATSFVLDFFGFASGAVI